MNIIQRSDNRIVVSLSRRNLLTLLKMLDVNVGQPALWRQVLPDTELVVQAEEDAIHYAAEDRLPEHRGQQGIGPEDLS